MKVHDFVLTPNGNAGLVTEVHAGGKTAKVQLIGYTMNIISDKVIDVYPIKKLTSISRTRAWEIAPRFPGIDC